MNKPPAFQFYAADFLVDAAVKHMTLEERGAFVTLLAHSWIDGPLPRSATKLATLCGVSVTDMTRLWPALKPCWKPAEKPGFIINPRMEKERRKQAQFRKSQSDKAKHQQARHRLATAEPVPSSPSPSPRTTKTKPSAPTAPRETWLTPFSDAWTATYGGVPAFGELAKCLKPLTGAHAPGEVLDHWVRYLAATEARFASPARFAQTFGSWGKPDRSRQPVPDMYLTLEEQEARRARSRKPRGDVGEITDAATGDAA